MIIVFRYEIISCSKKYLLFAVAARFVPKLSAPPNQNGIYTTTNHVKFSSCCYLCLFTFFVGKFNSSSCMLFVPFECDQAEIICQFETFLDLQLLLVWLLANRKRKSCGNRNILMIKLSCKWQASDGVAASSAILLMMER